MATAKAKKGQKGNTEVVYPELRAELYTAGGPNGPVTVEHMKAWLGWQEDTAGDFGEEYLLTDINGVKVRCANNAHNRPFTESHCLTLAQDILSRNWADSRNGEDMTLNGEAIIFGRNGSCLSGQHRGIGLILAEQMRTSEKCPKGSDTPYKDHWGALWDGPVTLESVVVFGVSENPKVVRTLDNVRPRTLSDVLYTEGTFKDSPVKARKAMCRMLDYAVRYLWERTGMGQDAWSAARTHSESLDFVSRHKGVIASVKHVHDENGSKGIGRYVSPGCAAGMLYLMGMSASSGEDYHTRDKPSEKGMSKERWEKACEFWTLLASGAQLGAVRTALTSVEDGRLRPLQVQTAVVVRAWLAFLEGRDPTAADVDISDLYEGEEMKRFPSFGGIDLPERTVEPEPEPEPAAAEEPESEAESAIVAAVEELRSTFPGCVVLFRTPKGFVGYGEDAEMLAEAQGGEAKEIEGKLTFRIPEGDADITFGELHRNGRPVVYRDGDTFMQWLPDEPAPELGPDDGAVEEPAAGRKGRKGKKPKAPALRGGTN